MVVLRDDLDLLVEDFPKLDGLVWKASVSTSWNERRLGYCLPLVLRRKCAAF